MAKKKLRDLLILLFFVYIFAFMILYFVIPKETFSEKEKRALSKFPQVSLARIFDGRFESEFETWMSDHVPGREMLVGMNANYELLSGRNGLGSTVLAGGDRLIAVPEEFDEAKVAAKCDRINAFAEAAGIPTDVMIVPTAGYMAEEDLPLLHAEYRDAEVAQAVEVALAENVSFIWPEERLASVQDADVYYNTDHHLTSRGSYEICNLYLETLGKALPAMSEYDVETIDGFYGSMYAKAGLWNVDPDKVEIWRSKNLESVTVSFDDREPADSMFFMEHQTEMDKYPIFLDGNHAVVTIETGNTEGENLLLIRDSFGHCFAPFAADEFSRIVLIDLRYYRKPVTELVKEMEIDRALVLYGVDTFLTDTNFSWLK